MKKYISLLSLIFIIASCDVVEGPYDITEDCAGIIGGDNICGCTDSLALNFNITATFEDNSCIYDSIIYGCTDSLAINFDSTANIDDGSCIYENSTYTKKVLIEDFTGHTCPNCPGAARELEAIHDVYGDQIIGIALHVSTGFARPHTGSGKFEYDFRTEWGTQWDNFFNISSIGLPAGMINRIGFDDNTHYKGKDEWAATVALELEKEPDFGITINSNNNTIEVNTKVLNTIEGSYNLVVCLTESNIINWQKDGTVEVENYIHNHVLRTVLTDESLSNSTALNKDEVINKSFNYSLADLENYNINYSANTAEAGNGNAGGWNASNMSIIAYIYDITSQEIIQVEEIHL